MKSDTNIWLISAQHHSLTALWILKQPDVTKAFSLLEVHTGGCAVEAILHSCSLEATPGPRRLRFPVFFFLERKDAEFLQCDGNRRGVVLYLLVMDFLKGIVGSAGRHM